MLTTALCYNDVLINHIIHRNIQMGSQTTARYDSGGNIPTKSFQNTRNHALCKPQFVQVTSLHQNMKLHPQN